MATHALPAPRILDDAPDTTAHIRAPASRRPLLRRIYDAILQSQMRRARRDIDRMLRTGALSRSLHSDTPPER